MLGEKVNHIQPVVLNSYLFAVAVPLFIFLGLGTSLLPAKSSFAFLSVMVIQGISGKMRKYVKELPCQNKWFLKLYSPSNGVSFLDDRRV